MAKTQTGTTYEGDLYATIENDELRFYSVNPFQNKDKDAHKVDMKGLLSAAFGNPSLRTPLRLRIAGLRVENGEPFGFSALEETRRAPGKHIADMEGNWVEIALRPSGDEDYPFYGILIDSEGEVIPGHRKYSPEGECSDKVEAHRIAVFPDNPDTEA